MVWYSEVPPGYLILVIKIPKKLVFWGYEVQFHSSKFNCTAVLNLVRLHSTLCMVWYSEVPPGYLILVIKIPKKLVFLGYEVQFHSTKFKLYSCTKFSTLQLIDQLTDRPTERSTNHSNDRLIERSTDRTIDWDQRILSVSHALHHFHILKFNLTPKYGKYGTPTQRGEIRRNTPRP